MLSVPCPAHGQCLAVAVILCQTSVWSNRHGLRFFAQEMEEPDSTVAWPEGCRSSSAQVSLGSGEQSSSVGSRACGSGGWWVWVGEPHAALGGGRSGASLGAEADARNPGVFAHPAEGWLPAGERVTSLEAPYASGILLPGHTCFIGTPFTRKPLPLVTTLGP